MENINMYRVFAFKLDLASLNFISVPIIPIFLVDAYAANPVV
jgi:hypothetical protein